MVIGRTARYVELSESLDYVAGYTLLDDLSERELQNDRGGTWDKGKGCDTFGPVGPWLVTADEIGDPQDIDLWHDVNGVRYQDGNSREHDFSRRRARRLREHVHDSRARRPFWPREPRRASDRRSRHPFI